VYSPNFYLLNIILFDFFFKRFTYIYKFNENKYLFEIPEPLTYIPEEKCD